MNRAPQKSAFTNSDALLPALVRNEAASGIGLLDELVAVFSRYIILPKGGVEAAALWTFHAHAHDAASISPILAITSPEMRCGKTTMLEILQTLTPNAILTSNVTTPALFRLVDKYAPTLLIDEADTFLKNQEQMRGILNSGHRRSSATIVRIDGGREPRPFRTWSPKVIGCIGSLPDTLSDRSVVIRLQRKRREDVVERLQLKNLEHLWQLRSRIAWWARRHLAELRSADPEIPPGLHDRASDNWRPLFTIADAAGGPWPAKARIAAVQLSSINEETPATALLADIRDVFTDANVERIESQKLVSTLVCKEERTWAEWRNGKPITANQIATILRPFGIHPKTIRFGHKIAKGYLLSDLVDAFERYAPIKR
jgi:hypothetical protein